MDTYTQVVSPETQQALANCHPLVGDDWEQMSGRIPVDVEGLAEETQALQRKRAVRSARDLLRLVLAYSVCDWSLRLVGLWASVIGLAQLSDVAVRKRLLKTQRWLGRMIGAWLQQRRQQVGLQAVIVRLIDASVVSQPGSRGTDWRLHVNFDLGTFSIASVEVTDGGGGETLARQSVQAGEILVADRGHAHRRGLGHVLAASAYAVVRINGSNLPLESADGQSIDLLHWLQAEPPADQPREQAVWLTTPQGRFALRLIAQALPQAAAERARRRVRETSRKKGHTPSPLSLVAAGFLLVVTNLPAQPWATAQVLALYRVRWQVELLFKRLKGIVDLEALRTKDPVLAQVYLLGKLLGVLMLEDWHNALTGDLDDWLTDPVRPLSAWRWLQLWTDLLRHAIRGPLTLPRLLAALPRLGRYLRDAPRQRPAQGALARQWLRAFGIKAELPEVKPHAAVPA